VFPVRFSCSRCFVNIIMRLSDYFERPYLAPGAIQVWERWFKENASASKTLSQNLFYSKQAVLKKSLTWTKIPQTPTHVSKRHANNHKNEQKCFCTFRYHKPHVSWIGLRGRVISYKNEPKQPRIYYCQVQQL